jgi:general secretion pathway protein N
LFFLIAYLPASIVLSNITLPNNVVLSAISGSVWSGKIDRVNVASIDVGTVKWQLSPLSLIIGELSADISVVKNEQFLNTEINLSTSGKIEFEETRFSIDLSTFAPLTYGMPFSYSGKASGYFPISFFQKNNFVGLNGKLSLSSLKMIAPQEQYFGDFVVDFRAEKEGATSGKIKDNGGELSLAGNLSLKKNGQLNSSIKIAAREEGSALENMLSFLGKKDASGRIQLNNNIKLWN